MLHVSQPLNQSELWAGRRNMASGQGAMGRGWGDVQPPEKEGGPDLPGKYEDLMKGWKEPSK